MFSACSVYPRQAGRSAGNNMREWRKLRDKSPGLFTGLAVWAQPAAFADSVIHTWLAQREAQEFSQVVRLVDCFAGAWTACSKEACWLLQQLQGCVAPGCTAVSQITDTGLAAPAKAALNREKEELRELLKLKARQEGVQPRQFSEVRTRYFADNATVLRCAASMHLDMVPRQRQRAARVSSKQQAVSIVTSSKQ